MDLDRLIAALADPAAYPEAVADVEVCQTHISVVFLAGPWAYKIKKPVELGFLDFRTLERRRHFCQEEVRLNRRLAPTVYQGVVPVARRGNGLQLEGPGEPVEWAVKMRRLPRTATLEQRLERGELQAGVLQALAHKLAAFHAQAEAGPQVAAFGRLAVLAQNARENFTQAAPLIGTTLSPAVYERLGAQTEAALARLGPLIESRAERGVPRDTHGDLHLDHVYLLPGEAPPDDLVIIDCIEFNERFRYADPVADMAFLVMDLVFHGRDDLARDFAAAYFHHAGDPEGLALLPFYAGYRAAVRGKVEGIACAEKEVDAAERAAALARARQHWLLALAELEPPARKPCLLLVAGLPGSGKSTLAKGLADRAGFRVLRSDLVRQELAGRAGHAWQPAAFGQGLYTPEGTGRTYAECLRRAEEGLFEGQRVLIDASFRAEVWRREMLEAARRWGVPALLFLCRTPPEVRRQRLEGRRGDASTADWAVSVQAAQQWEEPGPQTRLAVREIATDRDRAQAVAQALKILRQAGLWAPASSPETSAQCV
jgi:aminoglycoside phosphotransferase family enzyme/predicted kinase